MKSKEDLKKLQGTWSIVDLEVDGQTMPTGGGSSTIVLKGDDFRTSSMGAVYEGKFELDATQTPRTFDLVFTEGPEKGNRSLGIYELDSDTWKICLTVTGKKRPKTFATKPGSGLALETLKRGRKTAKKTAAAPAEDIAFDESLVAADDLSGEWAMISCVFSGHPLEASLIKMGRRIAHDNEATTQFGSNVFMRARYTLDHKKKTIDYVHTAGTAKGKSQLGIWELKGNTLKVCFTDPGQPRPDSFESKPGSGRTTTVWKLIR